MLLSFVNIQKNASEKYSIGTVILYHLWTKIYKYWSIIFLCMSQIHNR